ncbi:MAG TPA: hypothetical protein VLA56_12540, partial [Pseudomonadales bacterium]|nr:hypothetical protein [Pseudomonadales bacterium]
MSRLAPLFSLALLAACSSTPEPRDIREVSLAITSPAYGEYLGDGPIEVVGTVSDAAATVLVEDVEVPVSGDGTFRTTVEFAGDYEVIDVKAGGDSIVPVRERVPVFAGKAPAETFVH